MPIETHLWKDFSAGWNPNDDAINGRPNGLLKMTNVQLDENGNLSLQDGTTVKYDLTGLASPTNSPATDLYSRFLGGNRFDYTALHSGQVFRDAHQLTASGATTRTGFGTAYDYVLIASGDYRVKDTGSGTPANLGIGKPTAAPTLTTLTYESLSSWIATGTDVHTLFGDGSHIATVGGFDFLTQWATKNSVVTVNGKNLQTFNFGTYDSANTTDTTILTQNNFGSTTTTQDPNDVFNLSLFSIDGSGLPSAAGTSLGSFYSMSITIYLRRPVATTMTGGTVMTIPSDYFIYSLQAGVPANGDDIRIISSNQIVLAIRRQQFQRVGGDSTLDWNTVVGYQLIVNTLSPSGLSGCSIPLSFQGGRSGMISGTNGINVQYAQMNVAVTPAYVAKSTLGPVASVVAVANVGYAILAQTPTDPQVTEVWIFRQDNGLDEWYRVLVIPIASIGTAQIDLFNDDDALTLDITVDLNLVSTASIDIPDEIDTIIGPIQGRWYYISPPFLYPSDIGDPDLTNVALGIRICGENSEVYLWAFMVNESLLLIGTSVDIYVLSGTFTTLPDGTIDLYYRPLGCKFPPISKSAVIFAGLVYYMSEAGWMSVDPNGQNRLLVSPQLDLLYGVEQRYDYHSIVLTGYAPGAKDYPVTIRKGKLYGVVTVTGRIDIYDFVRQYWRPCLYGFGLFGTADVSAITSTQDGQVLGYYAVDNKLRVLFDESTKQIDETRNQDIEILNVAMDGGQPRLRKDLSTFKSRVYTDGGNLQVVINTDQGSFNLGDISSSTLNAEFFLDISSILATCKWWQFDLTGNLLNFLLQDCSVDAENRPIPVTFKRSQPQNFSTAARKRFRVWPFVIDTLGNNITTSLYADGTHIGDLTVNTNGKRTVKYELESDLYGVDFELIHSAPLHEFEPWDILPPDVDVVPIQRAYFRSLRQNFGTASRKRLRVWPLVLNTLGNDVTANIYADGALVDTTIFNTTDKTTCFFFVSTDVFGVDYELELVPVAPGQLFEFWDAMTPEIVQTLPIAKRFDQIGPQELFRYGKILKVSIRIMPWDIGEDVNATLSLPYTLYFDDETVSTGLIPVLNRQEATYTIGQPKGTAGAILRFEIGPTDFDFHRFNIKILVDVSGKDTDGQWISIG